MASRKDIPTLEKFRRLVDRYLFLGYAPSKDVLWNAPPGLLEMEEAVQRPEIQDLRRQINELKPTAKQILSECGLNPIFTQYPAPRSEEHTSELQSHSFIS